MNTYFSKNLTGASNWEIQLVVSELASIPENCLATIQWNQSDDTFYGVSYLDESVINASDNGCIWYYEPVSDLLADIKAQL
jgi:hypothetical protein